LLAPLGRVFVKMQVRIAIGAVLVAALLAGCGSSSKSESEGSATTTTVATPEDQRTTPALVAAGLKKIDETVKELGTVTGTDKARATELSDGIEEDWEPIEGTIRDNDADAYITFEDQFAVLAAAAADDDSAQAKAAAAKVSKAVSDYLAAYPG
jgi:hypothetical protein